ncbi:MAG: filamentous hemagglutinin N-terminal domain-containing protein [Rivularia sp. ALOHA_DT_140]|nr:filamentous hemagglutinin N-terminal domain-containing protein [Rivularia sp. ALOHA_DT_140]
MSNNFKSLAIVMVSAIALLHTNSSVAQITPDATLPNNSNVNLIDNETLRIDGGTQAGSNLFHSFKEFSVRKGWEAIFNNGSDIQNILTRVTGKSISEIDGLIKANGSANLFLMNANGIIFGLNSLLEIGGSFIGTSADSMKFSDGSEFSAINPQSAPLLSINVPLGLQYGNNPGDIQVQKSFLGVPSNQTLALVGGNIDIQGGEEGLLIAPDGRIELGGLTNAGIVEIKGQQSEGKFNLTSLSFPNEVNRGDVSLSNFAQLNVTGRGSGSIAINAQNLQILSGNLGGSGLLAGIEVEEKQIPQTKPGDITLNATGKITIADRSFIRNTVEEKAIGNAGNINIKTGSLEVTKGSAILARNNGGTGNAGSVTIDAEDTVFVEASEGNGAPTIASDVTGGGIGNGNDIKIEANSIFVDNYAVIAASIINCKGDNGTTAQAGNVNISARNQLVLNNYGRIFSEVGSDSNGQGGTIDIKAPSVSLDNNASLITQIQKGGRGGAGDINIETDNLSIKGNSRILAQNAGGIGNAGSVTIDAEDTVRVEASQGNGAPTIASDVTGGGVGNGNDINIRANSIFVDNDAVIAASIINGKGDNGTTAQAGNVNISARNQLVLNNRGRIYSEVGEKSNGQGGIIDIKAPSVSLDNNASLITEIREGGQGRAGDINIETSELLVQQGAVVTVRSRSSGKAGGLRVDADSIKLDNQGQISANTTGGGGDISVNSPLLELRNGSSITTNASGKEITGGNITIDGKKKMVL